MIDGRYMGDVIYDQLVGVDSPTRAHVGATGSFEAPRHASWKELLVPVFRGGEMVYENPSIDIIRRRAQRQLSEFQDFIEERRSGLEYPVGLEHRLHEQMLHLRQASQEVGP